MASMASATSMNAARSRITVKQPTMAAESASVQYPDLVVFDLDACLWDKEMFEMDAIPTESDAVIGDLNGRGNGCVGVMSAGDKISLHQGALVALQEHADGTYPGMRIALASSANTPFAERVGRKALAMLEVVPGLTVWDLLMRDWDGVDVNQIGRQAPLSPNKAATRVSRHRAHTFQSSAPCLMACLRSRDRTQTSHGCARRRASALTGCSSLVRAD